MVSFHQVALTKLGTASSATTRVSLMRIGYNVTDKYVGVSCLYNAKFRIS